MEAGLEPRLADTRLAVDDPDQQRLAGLGAVFDQVASEGFGHRATPRTEAEELEIEGDLFLLHQALSNLLQNAIDFSPPKGVIDLRAAREGSSVRLELRDRGPGIPEYAKGKLFQRFFSLQRPDTGKKSTGLGLNFVQEVAKLHRGSIRLENLDAGGLCAVLVLPGAAQNITTKESR